MPVHALTVRERRTDKPVPLGTDGCAPQPLEWGLAVRRPGGACQRRHATGRGDAVSRALPVEIHSSACAIT